MRTDDKVTEDTKDAKHGNPNGVVRGGVYGEDEGIEAVVLKWDHGIFGAVPLAVFVERVFYGEPGRVPDAARTKSKGDVSGGGDYPLHSPQFFIDELGMCG